MNEATLEARVAALEELIARPLMTAEAPEWTPEQLADFERRRLERRSWPLVNFPPPAPALTPETAKALLRECVTVVSPGETLVVRVPDTWTPQQAGEYQEHADIATASGRISFPVLVLIGEELAVAKPFDEHAAEALAVAALGDRQQHD